MKSKKIWQAFAVISGFVLLTGIFAWMTGKLFFLTGNKGQWWIPFAFGAVFMIVSIVFSFLRERLPRFSWLSLLANAIACGLFIGAFLTGKSVNPSLWKTAVSAIAPAVFFLVLLLLLSVPSLKDKKWYIIVSFLIWLIAMFGGGFLIWKYFLPGFSSDAYLCFAMFSIAVSGLALGALLSADSFWELLYGMVTPSTVCIGFVAIIVLIALACGDGGDCDCGDCDCCDSCDCSPGYGGGSGSKKPKHTTMGDLGGPAMKK